MLSVLIRIDAAGETPLLVEDSETLCPGPAVRWRYVCEVKNREQGHAVVERLKRRPEYWNFDYDKEALDRAADTLQRREREPPGGPIVRRPGPHRSQRGLEAKPKRL